MKTIWLTILILFIFSCKEKTNSEKHSAGSELFEIVSTAVSGIDFENKVTQTPELNGFNYINLNNGAGVAIGDFNNDGLQDIYFLSTLGDNKLYLNKGNLHFEDISVESGTQKIPGLHTGVTTVDINSDGRMDIYICNSGPSKDPELRKNKLLVNQGPDKNGIPVFKEESSKYGLDIDMCSTQAEFFDFDRDGDLDLFLINHSPDPEVYKFENVEKYLHTDSQIDGDRLYENRNGKFVDISKKAGLINNSLVMALGLGVSDLNNDGWPDVYVCTDFMGKDALYLNNKNGTFTESSDKSLYHMTYASMGNDLADFNNDGWPDIFTCEMMAEDNYTKKISVESMNAMYYQRLIELGQHHQSSYNTLQLNNGNIGKEQKPVFSDIAQMTGTSATDWSWGPLVFDMDNDGKKDLFVSNGYKTDYLNIDFRNFSNQKINQMLQSGELKSADLYYSPLLFNVVKDMPLRKKNNYFFRNNGDLTFKKMNGIWAMDSLTCSNGAAYADFDNDGDMDIVVNNTSGPSFIYKNTSRENGSGNYLQLDLKGPAQNLNGIGTRIILHQANQIQMVEQYLTRGFQSSISPILHFGVGTEQIIPEVQVIWPDGTEQVFKDVKSNQRIIVKYSDGKKGLADRNSSSDYLFADVTKPENLNYRHEEDVFNDFDMRNFMVNKWYESIPPHRLSDLGPALAVGDVNKDGMEDFFVGGAKGFSGKLFLQTSNGFQEAANQPWSEDKNCEDVSALFFDADNDGNPDLYVVSGSNEYEEGSANLQDRLYLNDGSGNFRKIKDALPDLTGSGSCVIAGDFDGDGDLDLFVGGRQKPGKYPLPVDSHLLRNDSKPGKILFTDVTSEMAPQLKNIGMVTDAVFADIDNDKKPDLVLTGEWMPIRILKNKGNKFEDITEKTGLIDQVGWWNCSKAADFDKDGDLDFIVGNLGLNYKYKADQQHPFELYVKDFDNSGTLDLVMAYHYNDTLFPVFGRDRSAIQTPFIRQKFPTAQAFAKASLEEVYGEENLKSALCFKATNYATCYLENKGNGTFAIHPLANAAQISSVNSILTEDVDGDGKLDLIIAGNMYGSEPETTRNDASIGLYLKGDGKGNFEPVPAIKSGLFIDGDVRKVNLIHFGKIKSPGVIVAKNNDFMQLIKINQPKK